MVHDDSMKQRPAGAGEGTTFTAAEIDRLVERFYAEVRRDPELSPVFFAAIGRDRASWVRHEAKIASFWRNALHIDRSFRGNPMLKHMANRDITLEHFPIWLSLFRQVAGEVLPGPKASMIAALAERIGRGLAYGIESNRKAPGDIPSLRG